MDDYRGALKFLGPSEIAISKRFYFLFSWTLFPVVTCFHQSTALGTKNHIALLYKEIIELIVLSVNCRWVLLQPQIFIHLTLRRESTS